MWSAFSKIAGLVREAVVAAFLGTSVRADLVYLAFQIPHLARRLFVEGMFSGTLVPELEVAASEGPDRFNRLTGSLLFICSLGGVVAAAGGMLASPLVVRLTQPGITGHPELVREAVWLTRIMFGYLFFLGIAVVLRSLYEHVRFFSVPASAPLVFNIGIISFMALMVRAGIHVEWAFAFGILAGGALQVMVMLFYVRRLPLRRQDVRYHRLSGTNRMLRRLIPVGIAVAAPELFLMIGRAAASFLGPGRVASLDYAMRITEVAVGIGVLPLTMVILPLLSRHSTQQDELAIGRDAGKALQLVVTLCIPAGMGLWLLKIPIVRFLFERGTFTEQSAHLTAGVLGVFAFGIVAMGIYRVLCQVYFARRRTHWTFWSAVTGLVVTVTGCLLMTGRTENTGIAIAWVSGMWMSAVFLMPDIFLRYGKRVWWPFLKSSGLSVIASVPMILLIRTLANRNIPVLVLVVAGGLVYAITRFILMTKDERAMWRSVNTTKGAVR